MQFDYDTVLLAAILVAAPAIFAVITVRRHVSQFIRDVEREEREEKQSRKKQ